MWSRAEGRQVKDGRSCCVAARAAVTLWRKADATSKISLPLSPQLHRQEGLGITLRMNPQPLPWQVAADARAGHSGVHRTWLPLGFFSCRLPYLHCPFKCGSAVQGVCFPVSLIGKPCVLLLNAESNPSCIAFPPACLIQLMKL